MRILIVEDDLKLASLLKKYLTLKRYTVDHVGDGKKAEERAMNTAYDLIVLDWSLPSQDGIQVCLRLREAGVMCPIIMLTGRSEVEDKIKGLNSGADDYLAKPFDPDELLARIGSLLRRPVERLPEKLQIADLVLDPVSHTVTREGVEIQLMPKEFSLLEYLIRNPGRVITNNELLQHVWGVYSNTSSNRLQVYVRYLREKIDEPYRVKLIQTVRGSGYKLEARP
jgi:two-component system OmpR family response regulator